jgi:hypothetical protein
MGQSWECIKLHDAGLRELRSLRMPFRRIQDHFIRGDPRGDIRLVGALFFARLIFLYLEAKLVTSSVSPTELPTKANLTTSHERIMDLTHSLSPPPFC